MVQYFIRLCRAVLDISGTRPQNTLRALSSSQTPVKFSRKGKKLVDIPLTMALSAESEALLTPLRLAVKEQGDLVRQLKADKKPKEEVEAAVKILLGLKVN